MRVANITAPSDNTFVTFLQVISTVALCAVNATPRWHPTVILVWELSGVATTLESLTPA